MPEPTFEHKGIQKLYELYKEYDEKLKAGKGVWVLLWRSIGPSIPELLAQVDENDELRETISAAVTKIAEAFKEDA